MSNPMTHPADKRPIRTWFGRKQDKAGWIPESVATDVTRTIDRYGRSPTERDPKNPSKGKVVRIKEQEIVYMHHGYRPHLDGRKAPSTDFFFRGARICR